MTETEHSFDTYGGAVPDKQIDGPSDETPDWPSVEPMPDVQDEEGYDEHEAADDVDADDERANRG